MKGITLVRTTALNQYLVLIGLILVLVNMNSQRQEIPYIKMLLAVQVAVLFMRDHEKQDFTNKITLSHFPKHSYSHDRKALLPQTEFLSLTHVEMLSYTKVF